MSDEIARKKQEEIEFLEKQEQDDKGKIAGDMCPVCGQRPTSYPYICFLPNPYGWLECVACGNVFVPKSVRDQKIVQAKASIARPSPIITEE